MNVNFYTLISLLLGTLVIGSCKARSSFARKTGHYENPTHGPLTKWDGQRLPPEYAPVQAVLVSDQLLLRYNRYDLVRGIIKAGAQVWVAAKLWPKKTGLNLDEPIFIDFTPEEKEIHKKMAASLQDYQAKARAIYERYTVVPVDSTDLIQHQGAIHCVTSHFPR